MPSPAVRLSLALIIGCAFPISPILADTFLERDGVLIMEAESEPAAGGWSLQRSIGGFEGGGYLVWTGSDAFAESSAGRGTLTYRFRIRTAGNYELRWRSRIARGNDSTEHNDSWVRFPSGRNVSGQQALRGWTKVFTNRLNVWSWQSGTVDNVGRPVRQYFSAGDHTLQISGRSSGHAIDRISLFKYDDVGFSQARFDSLGQSPTTGDAAATEPAPRPAAEPPATLEVDAPILSVNDGVLSWNAVEAFAINVHGGSGEWLESLPGDRTDWRAPSSGTYYVVATGEGGWETWGRSETVDVDVDGGAGAGASGLRVSSQVYSPSSLEIFWSGDDVAGDSFEVRRNGELLTIGDARSFFDDGLSPATRYTYTVSRIDASGSVVASGGVSASTLGGTASDDPSAGGLVLTAQVHSQSAVEVFWSAESLDPAVSHRFEIVSNGEPIGVSDGRSLFIEGLTADTGYEFTVSATAADGGTILSNAVLVRTFAPDRQ